MIIPLIFDEGCLGKYDQLTNSVNLFHKYSYSTKFIRNLHPADCNGLVSKEPCHVYVTASEPDPSTNIIVNFQLAMDTCGKVSCDPMLYYGVRM